MSQKTGVAPVCTIVLPAATKLSEGSTTSSPALQPTASNAMWSAAVPFATAIACLTSEKAANCSSNSDTRGPMLHQPEASVSCAAAIISASTTTSESGTVHCPEA